MEKRASYNPANMAILDLIWFYNVIIHDENWLHKPEPSLKRVGWKPEGFQLWFKNTVPLDNEPIPQMLRALVQASFLIYPLSVSAKHSVKT